MPRYFFTIRGRDQIKDDHYGTNLPDVAAALSIAESKRALAAFIGQGNRLFVPFYQGLLAEIEAERQDANRALARINDALALVSETGEHLDGCFVAAYSRRYSFEVRTCEYGFGRGSIPYRHRHRATAEGKELRTPGGALSGEALSLNRPCHRRVRRSCAGA